MANLEKFNFNSLSPFKWFVLNNFPFIDADFDAMTEWQLFQKIGVWINKIIDSQNTVGTEMEKVVNGYIELYNYVDNFFKNLDVQDEINNKLNEMVTDGTLTNILLNYTNVERIYNTFTDIINDINNLYNNMKIKTLGYYNINDGGDSVYLITNIKNNNYIQIQLNDEYYATLINSRILNVLKIGFHKDGLTDNFNLWENLYNTIINNINVYKYSTIYFPEGVYYFSNSIKFPQLITITGDETNIMNGEDYPSVIKFTPFKDKKKNGFNCITTSYQSAIKNLCIDLTDSYNCEFNRTNVGTPNDIFTETVNVEATALYTDRGGQNTYQNIIIKNSWKAIHHKAYNNFNNIGIYNCKYGFEFTNDTLISNIIAFNVYRLFTVNGALNQISNVRCDNVYTCVINYGNQNTFSNFTTDWVLHNIFSMLGAKYCNIDNLNYRASISIYGKDTSLEDFSDDSYIDISQCIIAENNNADYNIYNINFLNKINIRDGGTPLYIYPTLYTVGSNSDNETSHSTFIITSDVDIDIKKSNIKRYCYPLKCKNFNMVINNVPYKISNLSYNTTETTIEKCSFT